MKVCWLCNYPSPYAMKQYELISKEIDLTVVMLGGKEENRNDEWKINDNLGFKIILIDNNYRKIIKQLAKENDLFIDSLYASKYGIIAVHEFKKLNKKVCFLADGGIAKDRGLLINTAMSILMNRHDYFLSSSKFTDNYFMYYGVNDNKIYHYRFSSLTKQDIKNNKNYISYKDELRKKLGISNKFTLISVGQPIRRKGFDILLKAYIKTNKTKDINLYIVGGKPQQELIDLVEDNKLDNVHFVGLLGSEELKEYYAASDGFILCTREDIWGLVIQEAMSFGLPIITSNMCVAGLHFADLTDSVKICDVEDIDGYTNKILDLYNNHNNFNNSSQNIISDYSIENSAKDIINILKML